MLTYKRCTKRASNFKIFKRKLLLLLLLWGANVSICCRTWNSCLTFLSDGGSISRARTHWPPPPTPIVPAPPPTYQKQVRYAYKTIQHRQHCFKTIQFTVKINADNVVPPIWAKWFPSRSIHFLHYSDPVLDACKCSSEKSKLQKIYKQLEKVMGFLFAATLLTVCGISTCARNTHTHISHIKVKDFKVFWCVFWLNCHPLREGTFLDDHQHHPFLERGRLRERERERERGRERERVWWGLHTCHITQDISPMHIQSICPCVKRNKCP